MGLSGEEIVNDKARQPRNVKVKEFTEFVRLKMREIIEEANRLELNCVSESHAKVIRTAPMFGLPDQFVHIYFDMAVEDK